MANILSELENYRLSVKVFLKSNAKLFKLIPLKSVISGEPYKLSFLFKNLAEETFPRSALKYNILWPTDQFDDGTIEVPPLKKNDSYNSPWFTYDALSDGFGLVFIRESPQHEGLYRVKDEEGRTRKIQFYRGKHPADIIRASSSIEGIKAKTWEEIYEHWALIFAMFSLAIIALEKLFSLWNWLFPK